MGQAMSRWQAFGIHLAISTLLLLAMLTIILLLWYPGLLFSVDGGWTGLRIVIGVDLVLGPLLTLVVFKAGKPGLKFDLSCIAIFQLVCMAAGMWIVYDERPVALVLAYDTFYSLSRDEFETYEKDTAFLGDFAGGWPKLLHTELPENYIQADIVAIRSEFIGDPLYIQTERYRAIPETDTAAVFRRESNVRAQISEELKSQLPENCLLSRFVSSITAGLVCFNPESMKLESFYELDLALQTEEVPGLDV